MVDKLSEKLSMAFGALVLLKIAIYKFMPDKAMELARWNLGHAEQIRMGSMLLAAGLFYMLVMKGEIPIHHFGASMFVVGVLYCGSLLRFPDDLQDMAQAFAKESKKGAAPTLDELLWVGISAKILMDVNKMM